MENINGKQNLFPGRRGRGLPPPLLHSPTRISKWKMRREEKERNKKIHPMSKHPPNILQTSGICCSIQYCKLFRTAHRQFQDISRTCPGTFPEISWNLPRQIHFSLNSLSVRVPHNLSRRVLQMHGPNPWAGIGFAIKPMVFRKTNVFGREHGEAKIVHL